MGEVAFSGRGNGVCTGLARKHEESAAGPQVGVEA